MIATQRNRHCVVLLLAVAGCKTMGGPPPAVSEWLSFDKRRGLIEFDVEINGVPARAALDTGATLSALDPEFAAKAGIHGYGGGLHRRVRRESGR